jgi:uncharacterized damage-inducible protein DinB
MKHLILYNWKVRDEWIDAFQPLSHEELIRERLGGVGSILKTIFHIVDVEYSWIQVLMGEKVADPRYEDYMSLDSVRDLSIHYREQIKEFISSLSSQREYEQVTASWSGEQYYLGEVLRHIIAHEIHHIGQLSVWAKEVGIKPVSTNFIGRGFMD